MNVRRILVPVDFSMASKDAVRAALTIAERFDAEVELLHMWMRIPGLAFEFGAQVSVNLAQNAVDGMRTFVKELDLPENARITTRVAEGEAWPAIIELSKSVDMIVMGTHGRTGLDRVLLGSTAERVIREASCPVLTVRNGAATPLPQEDLAEPRIVRAMVEDDASLRTAIDALLKGGFDADALSVVVAEDDHEVDFAALDETKAKEAATSGGLLAGTVGGILGGLAGVGSVVTTGGLALFVLGPALGFAAVGGAVGGLLGRTVPADRAKVLKAQISSGSRLIAVHVDGDESANKAMAVLKATGADLLDM